MKKTLREVVSLRTSIQKFEVNGKRKLRKPVDQFAEACKELLKIVNEAERPLREQLDAYEARRQEGVTKVILHKYEEMALDAGIREEFRSCEILSKWMNKTAKLKDIYEDISRLVSEQATAQKQHDDLKELRNSRRELALLQIEKSNRDYALATPITSCWTHQPKSLKTRSMRKRCAAMRWMRMQGRYPRPLFQLHRRRPSLLWYRYRRLNPACHGLR